PVLRGVVRLACEHTEGLAFAGEAATGEEAVEACRAIHPDVVVLDLTLPGSLQGFDVARALRTQGTADRILILTGRTDEETVFEAIVVGADGYLEKTSGVRSIADALLRIARGERVFTPKQEQAALSKLGELARRTRLSSDVRAVLTERELQILDLLARGFTVKQVATRVGLSPRTVEKHISNLYRKLGVRNRVQAISKATAIGLVELS
ncbi:MAG TPA: response regulator transcription factor, partial [Actinomycetota bacterium]|nr:response regulator transcription factor [Actinomycetota bacterium]